MAIKYKDRHEILPLPHRGIVLQHTFQQGQRPLLPSVYNMEVVEVPSIGVMLKSKLELKCMTTLYNYIKRG